MSGLAKRPDHWLLAKRTWLRAGTANGCACAAAMAATFLLDLQPATERLVRAGSQFGFAHSMVTIACLTFINAGAVRARRAAWMFLAGSLLVSAALAVAAVAPWACWRAPGALGALICLLGWATLFEAALDILG